jgi:nitronate monooxygenase
MMRTRLTDLLDIEVPIVQAPMAGSGGAELAAAVAAAGGLGSLPTALLTPGGVREVMRSIRSRTSQPLNLNFFCHQPPADDPAPLAAWLDQMAAYYAELGVDRPAPDVSGGRASFDVELCELVEELAPEVVSFHFGLPQEALLERVRAIGAKVISSATTVAEARWLAERGCDAVIAQGAEAGGHRGMFLTDEVSTQVGTMSLVPQVVDAVDVPVIAAGGIGDGRGIAAALALGADGVQLGTAFLRCPEATISPLYRDALAAGGETVLTNVITGRPARAIVNRLVSELGPLAAGAPPFPLAALASGPLRAAAEAGGSDAFSSLWSGQAAAFAREVPAGELVAALMRDTEQRLGELANR